MQRQQARDCAAQGLLDNVSPTFRGPLIKMTETGTVHYMCTRNNNFSNRCARRACARVPLYLL